MIAARRSAARAVRPEAVPDDPSCGTAGFAAAVEAALAALAAFLPPRRFAGLTWLERVDVSVMIEI
jgi:hypothetical protein